MLLSVVKISEIPLDTQTNSVYAAPMKTEPNQLRAVLATLTSSLGELANPTKLNDPHLKEFINSHEITYQFLLLEKIVEQLAETPANPRLEALLLRTLSLLGRTRTRHSREEPKPEALVQTAQREEARTFLLAELADGPRPAKDLFIAARKLGIAQATLYRAKTELQVVSTQVHPKTTADPATRFWTWSLPETTQVPKPSESPGVR